MEPDDYLLNVFLALQISLDFIGLVCHGIGIYAIIMYKRKSNQKIILLNLCVSEVVMIICGIILNTYENYSDIVPESFYKIFFCIRMVTMLSGLFIMYILTFDRLICAINPLKYKLRITRTKLMIMFLISFLISVVLGVLSRVVLEYETIGRYVEQVMYIMVGLYIVFAILSYSIIITIIRKSKVSFELSTQSGHQDNVKRYLVTGLIILSFVLCYVTSSLLRNIPIFRHDIVAVNISKFLVRIGCFVDPVIFVLLTPHYRKIVLRCFNCGA